MAMRTTIVPALAALGALIALGGCGFRIMKASDLEKMQAAAAASARPGPSAEPLHQVKRAHVAVELGEEKSGQVAVGEAGQDYGDIPRFPNSRQVVLHDTAAGNGNSPRQADMLAYQTRAPLADVDAYYRRVLPDHGWRVVPQSVRHGSALRAATYRKGDEVLQLEFSRLLHSMLRNADGSVSEVTLINLSLAGKPTASR